MTTMSVDEVETNGRWGDTIEIVGHRSFLDTLSELIPAVSLGEDVFLQTLSAKAAIRRLRDFENNLGVCRVHAILRYP